MKKTLVFNYPDDEQDFDLANDGHKYYYVLTEMDAYLRSLIKYQSEDMGEHEQKIMQAIRDKLHELAADQGVTL